MVRRLNGPLGGDYATDGIGNAVPINTYPVDASDRYLDRRLTESKTRSNCVIAIGDSIMAGGTDETLGRYGGYTSPFSYASLVSKGRIRHLKNAGTSGQTSTQIAARFATDVIDLSPGAVVIMAGTNDDATAAMTSTRANITAMVNAALAAGILPVLCTIPPADARTTTQRTNVADYNKWLMEYAAQRGILAVDTHSTVVDTSNGNWKSNYSADGIHPIEIGAREMGQLLSDKLAPLLPDTTLPLHAAASDYGNLITNGCFVGDANSDGWANNWSFLGGPNTPTPSLVAASSPVVGYWQKVSTATDGSATFGSTAVNVGSGFSVGDTLLYTGLLKTVTCVTNASRVNVYLRCAGASSQDRYPIYNPILDTDYSAIAYKFVVPSGTTSIQARAQIIGGTNGQSQELWVAQMTLLNLTAIGLS